LKTVKFFTITFLVISSVGTFAKMPGQCGEYVGEGYLVKDNRNIIFVLDKGSESEITINFGDKDIKKCKYHIDTKMRLRFSVNKPCEYKCEGEVVKIIKSLEPYSKPQTFSFPRPKPIKKKSCR